MKKLLFSLFSMALPTLAFPQWGILKISATTSFNAVHVIDSLNVFIVGDSGMIYKTGDGGSNWNKQNSGVINENLYSVFFINKDIGFITGQNGLFLKTTNGGVQWQKIIFSDFNLNDIYFTDSGKGFIVGENGLIFTTNDLGNNWTEVFSGTTFYLNSIRFKDDINGFITGSNGVFLKTKDGGANWQNININNTNTMYDLFFANKDTGILVGMNHSILKTTDGAISFTAIPSGFGEHYYSLHCFNDIECHTAGNKETIIKIENLNKVSKENGNGTKNIKSIGFYNKYIGYCAGTNGLLMKTCPVPEFSANTYIVNLSLSGKVVFSNFSRNYTKVTWLFGDGSISVEKNPVYYYKNAGNYEVKLIVENQSDCKDTVSKLIQVVSTNKYAEELTGAKIIITPNPFDETLIVDIFLTNSFLKTIEIHGLSGGCFYTKKINDQYGSRLHLSLEKEINKFAPGIYFLSVETDKGFIYRKLIKL